MVLRGQFGDTEVEPAVLFDVHDHAGQGPPADAIDVQFRAPLTFSLLVDALMGNDRELDARTCFTVYEQVISHTIAQVQAACGYVTDDGGATSWPARLEISTLGENQVPGIETVRMHHHLWIGATAEALHDGVRRPADRGVLRNGLRQVAWSSYLRRLRELSELACDVTWGQPRPGAAEEIVDPPFHEHLVGHELGVCPSPWGPREIWEQPTAALLAAYEASERQVAADAERGFVYWSPPGTGQAG